MGFMVKYTRKGTPLTIITRGYIIMKRSFIDRFIHSITEKPKHCVKVKNPPRTVLEKLRRPQDARQEQYNRWSRHFKVYSGSYLPQNDRKLIEKGWEDRITTQNGGKIIQRKSTGQTVRFEKHGENPKHYHWIALWKKKFSNAEYRKFKNKDFGGQKIYYDEYGNLTSKRDPAHHLYGEQEND